eukprot:gnl/MRDRNA2_/MRDRNA2_161787_c0_seq1.p1 gnl/MRDRNA2_/MRDRNA2_161787_c0~~gnl/MRDRNA2_/MRDRNA2_161787_c0_seq1.p1  ORF type:complete len:289 (+),score=43.86 gnl/MRDRNA2_/MRDRNA2_161787_c0_seq1:39-869(+)
MAASEVFTKMLTSEMRETHSGRISLIGKKKADFECLMSHLDLRGGAAPPRIDDNSVTILLKLSDEYQILGLKSRCEDHLIGHVCMMALEPKLQIALEFGLRKLKEACAKMVALNVYTHRSLIIQCVKDPEAMKIILPPLRRKFGLTPEIPDDVSPAEALCPLIVNLMEMKQSRDEEWPCKKQQSYYVQRAQYLEQLVTNFVPGIERTIPFQQQPHEADYDRMVPEEYVVSEVKKRCRGQVTTFDVDEIKVMITCLVERRKFLKTGKTGRLYRWTST